MDEPCANLDYGNQTRIMEQISTLAGRGYLVLVSTHNPDHALLYADEALLMDNGGISCAGPPREVMDEGVLERIYGVPVSLMETRDGQWMCCPQVPRRCAI